MLSPEAPLPKLIPGARIVLADSPVGWLALPTDVAAWSRLTRLLSLGKRRAVKGSCHLTRDDLLGAGAGMVLIALPPDPLEVQRPGDLASELRRMQRAHPGQCFLGAAPHYDGRDQERFDRLARLAQSTGLAIPRDRPLRSSRASRRSWPLSPRWTTRPIS